MLPIAFGVGSAFLKEYVNNNASKGSESRVKFRV